MKKAIIIGAGYGGIALATLLAKYGYDVHVYEKNNYAGGRIAIKSKMALRLILAHPGI